jgi:hypothetical protein
LFLKRYIVGDVVVLVIEWVEFFVLILWWLWEVLTSMCNPGKNIIFQEARRNPKALDITLEDKLAKGNI